MVQVAGAADGDHVVDARRHPDGDGEAGRAGEEIRMKSITAETAIRNGRPASLCGDTDGTEYNNAD